MKRFFTLFATFFLLTGCSEEKEQLIVDDFTVCEDISYSIQPENLILPPAYILDRCKDYKALSTVDFDKVWQGWGNTPTDLLIIDSEFEFLFMDRDAPEGFSETGTTNLYARPRVFDPNLKATFPAFSATPVIIIGAPTQEEIDSGEWTSTLWHEHFHQFQMSQPGYGEATTALGLSGGDQTGMWMINFPFPYGDEDAVSKFHEMTSNLLAAYGAINSPDFGQNLSIYLSSKRDFAKAAGTDNYKYFQFQIWQEGLVRYTELMAFKTLFPADELSGEEYPFQRLDAALDELTRPTLLKDYQRVSFYSFGLIEGLILDAANPDWKDKYWEEWLQVDSFYE